jgi:hypothetical protein
MGIPPTDKGNRESDKGEEMKYKVIVTNLETDKEVFNEDVTLVIVTGGNVGKDGLIYSSSYVTGGYEELARMNLLSSKIIHDRFLNSIKKEKP